MRVIIVIPLEAFQVPITIGIAIAVSFTSIARSFFRALGPRASKDGSNRPSFLAQIKRFLIDHSVLSIGRNCMVQERNSTNDKEEHPLDCGHHCLRF
jgi:hypothetical protein